MKYSTQILLLIALFFGSLAVSRTAIMPPHGSVGADSIPTKTPIVYAFDDTSTSTGLLKEDSTIVNSPSDTISYDQEAMISQKDLRSFLVYPDYAKRSGTQGVVRVRALIDRNGKCVKGYVASSDSDMLNEAAIYSVKRSRFKPAYKDNKTTPSWIEIPVSFFLKQN